MGQTQQHSKDRSSTSSEMMFCCSCMVASWSRTQKSIALSTELKTVEPELEIRLDSSSARQWLQRTGIGRLKHLASRGLWLQDLSQSRVRGDD